MAAYRALDNTQPLSPLAESLLSVQRRHLTGTVVPTAAAHSHATNETVIEA
jgi:hypothetical protein